MIRLLLAFIAVLALSAGPTVATAQAAGQPCAMTDQMPMDAVGGHHGQAPDPCDHHGKACADACAAMSIADTPLPEGRRLRRFVVAHPR